MGPPGNCLSGNCPSNMCQVAAKAVLEMSKDNSGDVSLEILRNLFRDGNNTAEQLKRGRSPIDISTMEANGLFVFMTATSCRLREIDLPDSKQ